MFKEVTLAGLAITMLFGAGDRAGATSSDASAETRCRSLGNTEFSDIQDAPTQTTETKLTESASGDSYCQVQGYVWPQVGLELRLPAENWNGKFIELGCGGYCGQASIDACPSQYACITSTAGHEGTSTDALWGYNNLQARIDWGYRAAHVIALAGKALTERFYHRAISRSYFMGASMGGRQALQEAQHFPWDFEGIVAIAPPVDLSVTYMTLAWGIRVLHDPAGKPLVGKSELKLLTDAALAKCDLDDGVRDGVIGDPLACKFDPGELACKTSQSRNCLTVVQIDAVRKVYAGPINANGRKLSPGGPVVGSELGDWDSDLRSGWGATYLGVGVGRVPHVYETFVTAGLRYLFFWPDPGPTWTLKDFDIDRDSRRLGMMQAIYDSSNPDLRSFKRRGGKLLIFQGLDDNAVSPRTTIQYFEAVERVVGGEKSARTFCRLFLLPGVGHMSGGAGADTVDYLGALEAWIEQERAPDRLIAAHLKDRTGAKVLKFPLDPSLIVFTRPVYPYPMRAKYLGHGDPNSERSFGPVALSRNELD